MKRVARAKADGRFVAAVRVQLVSEPTALPGAWKATVEAAARAAWALIGRADREHLVAFFTDSQLQVVAVHTVAIGTATQSLVDAGALFRAALLAGAHRIILAHNHPSGSTRPSADDWTLWRRVREAGELLGIKVEDSLLVTPDPARWLSLERDHQAAVQAEREQELEAYRQKRNERRQRGNRSTG
jgi:DNA repair protein RadC